MGQVVPGLRPGEGASDLLEHRVRIDVADDDEAHVVGRVPARVEVQELLAREALHALLGADHGQAVGVRGVGRVEEGLRERAARRVLAAPDLLEHDLGLASQLVGVEGGVLHGVGQHVDPDVDVAAGHRDVVDGHVERGEGVDVSARGLDRAGDLAHCTPLRPLEEHVLEDVRHARLLLALVRAAHAHPHVQGNDGSGVVFDQHDVEAVVQSGAHEALLVHRGGGRLRRLVLGRRPRAAGAQGCEQRSCEQQDETESRVAAHRDPHSGMRRPQAGA